MPLADDLERNLLEIPVPQSGRVDVYSGVARLSGATWASEVKIRGRQPDTAVVMIHPTANFLGHYALPTLAACGVGAIGMTTRYIGNDSNLTVENCLLGATVRYLRGHGYRRVVLAGNSGGAFVVHGTSADLRFLDAAIDASDRPTGSTLWGTPEVANYLPAGVSRYTTLRSWINQWSVNKTLGNALIWLPKVEAPVLVLGGSADSGSPPAIFGQLYDAVQTATRKQIVLDGATHYFEGQPDKLRQACEAMAAW